MTRDIPYSFLNLTFLVFFLLTPTMKLTIRRTTWEKHRQRRIEAPPALSRFWSTTKSWSQKSVPRDMYYVTISGRVCPANVAKTLYDLGPKITFGIETTFMKQVHATMGWESSKIPTSQMFCRHRSKAPFLPLFKDQSLRCLAETPPIHLISVAFLQVMEFHSEKTWCFLPQNSEHLIKVVTIFVHSWIPVNPTSWIANPVKYLPYSEQPQHTSSWKSTSTMQLLRL